MKKILVVFGTRPEAIKMAPIVFELLKNKNFFLTKICVTAQHREMLDQVLKLFKIIPDYDLDIMKPNQDLFELTQNILKNIKNVLQDFRPDKIIVHGDTTTSFVASLAAYYEKISVIHVEAGLRSGNLFSPWPEEGNRKLTSVFADFHFAPTENSKKNLLLEGVDRSRILVTGNTVIDSLYIVLKKINNDSNIKNKLISNINNAGFYDLGSKYILVTGHRRENFGKGFLNICKALTKIANTNPNINILYPIHLNPKVKNPITKNLSGISNIKLVRPFEYEEFVYLISKSFMILTDSGGIQEEAPSLGKPVLVMRNETERPEGIKAGTVKLVGSNYRNIVNQVQILIDSEHEYKKMSESHNPYGNGFASKKIIKKLRDI